MEKKLNLQMYADDPTTEAQATAATPGTAGKDNTAAADTGKAAEPEKKYTDADVDRIVKTRLAREKEQAKKEREEAEKLAEMNATQKAEYAQQKAEEKAASLEKELAEYKRQAALAEMTKEARKMLAEKDINIPDELLAMFVTTDAQQTKQGTDAFAKMYKEAVEAGVKARLKGEPPRVGVGSAPAVSEIEQRIKKYQ